LVHICLGVSCVVPVERGYHLGADQTTTRRLQSTFEAPLIDDVRPAEGRKIPGALLPLRFRSIDYERLWMPAQDRVQGSRVV